MFKYDLIFNFCPGIKSRLIFKYKFNIVFDLNLFERYTRSKSLLKFNLVIDQEAPTYL